MLFSMLAGSLLSLLSSARLKLARNPRGFAPIVFVRSVLGRMVGEAPDFVCLSAEHASGKHWASELRAHVGASHSGADRESQARWKSARSPRVFVVHLGCPTCARPRGRRRAPFDFCSHEVATPFCLLPLACEPWFHAMVEMFAISRATNALVGSIPDVAPTSVIEQPLRLPPVLIPVLILVMISSWQPSIGGSCDPVFGPSVNLSCADCECDPMIAPIFDPSVDPSESLWIYQNF